MSELSSGPKTAQIFHIGHDPALPRLREMHASVIRDAKYAREQKDELLEYMLLMIAEQLQSKLKDSTGRVNALRKLD